MMWTVAILMLVAVGLFMQRRKATRVEELRDFERREAAYWARVAKTR